MAYVSTVSMWGVVASSVGPDEKMFISHRAYTLMLYISSLGFLGFFVTAKEQSKKWLPLLLLVGAFIVSVLCIVFAALRMHEEYAEKFYQILAICEVLYIIIYCILVAYMFYPTRVLKRQY